MNVNYSTCEASVLINGNSVATYTKDGKKYIEAKDGSEYEILIKNNGPNRILAVTSVDGLNVLTGESATPDDSGYVVSGYSNCRIKGFRYNDEKVGAFKFVKKENSYASSKQNNTDINCGVIGVIIYSEKVNYLITTNSPLDPSFYNVPDYNPYRSMPNWTCDNRPNLLGGCYTSTVSCNNISDLKSDNSLKSNSLKFDMGSGWGKSKDSKVVDTEFEKGYALYTMDIYYASRQSLLDMGVIQSNVTQISFPKSFTKYATPPKGWVS